MKCNRSLALQYFILTFPLWAQEQRKCHESQMGFTPDVEKGRETLLRLVIPNAWPVNVDLFQGLTSFCHIKSCLQKTSKSRDLKYPDTHFKAFFCLFFNSIVSYLLNVTRLLILHSPAAKFANICKKNLLPISSVGNLFTKLIEFKIILDTIVHFRWSRKSIQILLQKCPRYSNENDHRICSALTWAYTKLL